MAVAQLFAGPGEEVVLDDVGCVATSFPSFFELLDSLTPAPPEPSDSTASRPRSGQAGSKDGPP